MAGRPKKRAKEKAQEKPPEPPIDNDFAARFMEELKNELPIDPEAPSTNLLPAASDPTQTAGGLAHALNIVSQADRASLALWWRDQMTHIEFVVAKRAEMCAAATEHPNAVFARLALTFGAEGKPKDVAATLLGMAQTDFDLHYGHEWAIGSAEVVGLASANLLRIALSSNDRYAVKAAVEIVNRRGGEEWRAPAQKLEINNGTKKDAGVIDSSKLSYEDRQLLKQIIERSLVQGVAGQLPAPEEE